jgi:formamidopyrimidine-DNA glycosylase
MPELPDVEAFKAIAERAVGRRIARARVLDRRMLKGMAPAALQQRLKNARLKSVARHGKHLFLEFPGAGALELHFGMNGYPEIVAKSGSDPDYARLMLDFVGGGALAYINPRRFGHVRLVEDKDAFITAEKLGPDALDRRFDRAFLARIAGSAKRAIKSVLMDQTRVAGIGNIYSDEILFQARIHPATQADTLKPPDVSRLYASIKNVLKTAVRRGAGAEGGIERLPKTYLLHERYADGHCPRCGTALATEKRGTRTGYFCPRCQRR